MSRAYRPPRWGPATRPRTARSTAPRLQLLVEQLCRDIVSAVCAATLDQVSTSLTARLPAAAPPPRRGAPPIGDLPSPLALDARRASAVLGAIASEHKLSKREAQLLTAGLHGVPRKYLAQSIGVGESTIKTQMKGLLAKLGQPAFDDAIWHVRSRVLAR